MKKNRVGRALGWAGIALVVALVGVMVRAGTRHGEGRATVEVRANVPCALAVDGSDEAVQGLAGLDLAPGVPHEVTASAPGYESVHAALALPTPGRYVLSVWLAPRGSRAELSAAPHSP